MRLIKLIVHIGLLGGSVYLLDFKAYCGVVLYYAAMQVIK